LLEQYRKTENPLIFEKAINEKTYKELARAAFKLRGDDRKYGGALILREIDFLNILTLITLIHQKISPSEKHNYLMDVYGEIKRKQIEDLIQILEVEVLLHTIRKTKYRKVMDQILKKSDQVFNTIHLQQIFNEALLKAYYQAFYEKQLHLGVVLAFINLKRIETLNLRAILIGKIDELPPSEIVGYLIR